MLDNNQNNYFPDWGSGRWVYKNRSAIIIDSLHQLLSSCHHQLALPPQKRMSSPTASNSSSDIATSAASSAVGTNTLANVGASGTAGDLPVTSATAPVAPANVTTSSTDKDSDQKAPLADLPNDLWSDKVPLQGKINDIIQTEYDFKDGDANAEFADVMARNKFDQGIAPYLWSTVPVHYVVWLQMMFMWLRSWAWLITKLPRGSTLQMVKKYLAYLDRTLNDFFEEVARNSEDMTPDWASQVLDFFLRKEYHIGRHSIMEVQHWLEQNDGGLLLQNYEGLGTLQPHIPCLGVD